VADSYDKELFEALDAVVRVLERGRDRLDVVAARATELRDGRQRGMSYAELLTGAKHPLVIDVLSELLDGLFDAGSRLRRAEARALYADSLSMEKIASLLHVSRQRVSAIINSPFGQGDPEHVDVHDRRSALSLTAPELRLIAESLPQLVGVADLDGAAEYVNEQTVDYTGLPRTSHNAWDWLAVVHPDDQEVTVAGWRAALESGAPFEMECRMRRADGEYRWHLCRSLPIRGPDGRPVKWLTTASDVDDYKKLQETVARLQSAAVPATSGSGATAVSAKPLPQRP
jgi:PAS domain S-box-containing protein